jgi:hypothetical protein
VVDKYQIASDIVLPKAWNSLMEMSATFCQRMSLWMLKKLLLFHPFLGDLMDVCGLIIPDDAGFLLRMQKCIWLETIQW